MPKRICLIVVLIVALATLSHAGLMVTPTREEITLPPGGTFEGSYKVTNGLGKATSIGVESRYWYASKEEEATTKITDWLTVSTPGFTFEPDETVEVKYSVKLSTSMTGMRAAMITFIPSGQENQGVTLVVSVSLFVTVAGTEKRDWDFSDLVITDYQGSTQFSVTVNNKGNVHVRPIGRINIASGKKNIMTLELPETRPAYPGQKRQVVAHASAKEVFPKPGKYKVTVSLTGSGITKEKQFKVKVTKTGVVTVK